MQIAVGQFAAATGTGDQTVSGIVDQDGNAFTPKVLLLWGCDLTSNAFSGATGAYMFLGCATGASERWTVCYGDLDNANTMVTARNGSASACVMILTVTNPDAIDGQADFVSFGSGSFTINWSNAPASAYLINYMVLGGTDLARVKAGTITLATTGAEQSFTDPGFQPDFLLTAHELLSPLGASATAEIGVGAASSPAAADQAASVVISRDGIGTSAVGSWQKGGVVALGMTSDTAADLEATLLRWDPTGFTLSLSDLPAAARVLCYLAIQGGQWKVGVDTENTSNAAKNTSLPFSPVGVGFFSYGMAANTAIDSTVSRLTIGAGDGTDEGFAWMASVDGAGLADTGQKMSNASALGFSTVAASVETVQGTADLTLGANQFTLTWASTDGTARQFIYWAMGSGGRQPRNEAINFQDPALLMKRLGARWRRQRSGILVPEFA